MGEIVNLRRARKAKKRTESERTAEANRVAFGRTRDERTSSERQKALAARKLDGHFLRADDEPT
jgi:hypothetical protein